MKKLNQFLLSLSLVTSAFVLHAQESTDSPCDFVDTELENKSEAESVELLTSFIAATPLDRPNPSYPTSAARARAEGWVKISYVVDKNGQVIDPVIEDSGGHRAFRGAAMSAVKKWEFTPATQNGETVEQCKSSVRLDFVMGGQSGASRRFVNRYRKADEQFKNGNIEEANESLQALLANKDRNRYENAWAWSLDAQIAAKLQDTDRELNALNKTIESIKSHSSENQTFKNSFTNYLYVRLFVMQVQKFRFGDALQTFEKINEMDDNDVILSNIAQAKQYMDEYLNSDQNVFVNASIENEGVFFHRLARQSFGFTNIEGKLETVEVRCDSKREIYTVAPDNIWKIPQSWGQCQLLVSGDEQTSFDLVEVVSA